MIRAKGQRLCLCLEAHEFLGEPGKSIRDGGEMGPAYDLGFHSQSGRSASRAPKWRTL